MNKIFKIVPANAGAGKTYFIKETLTKWVKNREIAPERILAVTFTEAAAEELRERIRASLMQEGMVGAALDIERAYVSTIHGLGHRLLREHAFAAGTSPQPVLLDEASRDLLIRKAIAGCDALDPVTKDLGQFGYRYKLSTAEDQFREAVLKMIDQLRNLGNEGMRKDIAARSVAILRETYGEVEADGAPLEADLHNAIEAMLQEFPDSIADQFGAKAAQKEFRADFTALRKGRDIRVLQQDWRLWKSLRNLRQTKRGSETPDAYDTAAGAVILAANSITVHPGPLEDACLHLDCMIKGAQSIIDSYSRHKRDIGVVDFSDMIAGAETLLRENETVLQAVLAEIDCVVIDEFQDTNPVQFAFLWRLASRAKRTVLVGDIKQSIMGFQGADVRLTEALVEQHQSAVEHLPLNWRSDPRLVDFTNRFSKGLFGEQYHDVAANRGETGHTFLEVVRAPNGRGSRGDKTRPYHNIALRIEAMIRVGEPVTDRETGLTREIRPADIAVLCQSHAQLSNYADALTGLGVPVQVESGGWLDSPVVQLARFALAFAADPSDRYAALGLLTLGPVAMPVQEALEQVRDETLVSHPALTPLALISGMDQSRTMTGFVAEVLARSGLAGWVATQPDPHQLRADLLRLEHEAGAFCDTPVEMRAAAGFYGDSVKVFLGWLVERQSERGADNHPNASGKLASGVELVTWHSAKGREWPVVIVAQLDEKIKPRPGALTAEFDGFSDLDNVLSSASLGYFPLLDIPEKSLLFADRARPEEEKNARRLLYVALTRARDRLVLEWPDASVGKSEDKDDRSFVDLFMEEADIWVGDDHVSVGDVIYPALVTQGDDILPDCFTGSSGVDWPAFVEFGREEPDTEFLLTPWRSQPSAQEGAAPGLTLAHVELGDAIVDAGKVPATERGTAWHLALRVFLSDPGADSVGVQAATGLSEITVEALRLQAGKLQVWLNTQGYSKLHLELPIQRRAETGAEMNAIIDCLAESETGYLIIDHKTGVVTDEAERFAGYWPQLEAYRQLVRDVLPDKPVRGIAINWVSEGRMALVVEGQN